MASYNYPKRLNSPITNNSLKPNSQIGIKEILFLSGILSWTSIGYILGKILSSSRSKTHIGNTFFLAVITIGLIISGLSNNLDTFSVKTFGCYVFVMWLVAFDCRRQQFYANMTIHFANSTYLGPASYFFYIHNYPNFLQNPQFWLRISPSAPTAFNMLLLCLLFQNLGYYFLGNYLHTIFPGLKQWSLSSRNLVNLLFIKTKIDQLKFFLLFASIGLVPFIVSAITGRFFYINAQDAGGSGPSFIIASLFAQFSPLFNVAWFYGIASSWFRVSAPSLQKERIKWKANPPMTALSWCLIGLNFIYQLISGSKGRFLGFVILPLATVYFFTRQRISWLIFNIGVFIGGLSWIVIYPIMVNYRSLITTIGVGRGAKIQDLLSMAWNNLNLLSWEDYQTIIFTPFNNSGIAEHVVAMTSIVYYSVQQPAELLWQRLLLFWVPRFIWPDKPTILSGNLIGRLSGRLAEQDYVTSVVFPSSAELFLYLGLTGSILMILPGLLMRWFNDSTSPFIIFTPARLAIYFAYLATLSDFVFANFQSGIAGIVMQLSVLYITLYMVKVL
ncbi:MAG: hypothetical protein ACK5CA_02330 [Cyanobacteriota bacterium]|jgi:hypothetical protein